MSGDGHPSGARYVTKDIAPARPDPYLRRRVGVVAVVCRVSLRLRSLRPIRGEGVEKRRTGNLRSRITSTTT